MQVLSRAFLLGFYGFAVFSLVLATTLPDLRTAPSFLLATAVAMVVQLAIGRRARGGGATPTSGSSPRPGRAVPSAHGSARSRPAPPHR